MLARQAAAAVGVGTCQPWETTATLPLLGGAGVSAPTGGEGRGHIVAAARLQRVIFISCFCLFVILRYSGEINLFILPAI